MRMPISRVRSAQNQHDVHDTDATNRERNGCDTYEQDCQFSGILLSRLDELVSAEHLKVTGLRRSSRSRSIALSCSSTGSLSTSCIATPAKACTSTSASSAKASSSSSITTTAKTAAAPPRPVHAEDCQRRIAGLKRRLLVLRGDGAF